MKNLATSAINTWCPGCSNFGILNALKGVIDEFEKKGIDRENFVVVSGIGCHGKIADYLAINSFYALHGRGIAVATGIKIANPKLKVIVCAGDGDAYNEGISHLIHATKRNLPFTVLVHNNRTFALTTGQFTATSPLGFRGKSTPSGSLERPLNPLKLVLSSGGKFVARSYAGNVVHLQKIISKAVCFPGFAFVDVLQSCISFFNTYEDYQKRIYEMEEKDLDSVLKAWEKADEWNYEDGRGKIPIGIFYQSEK